MPQHDRGASHPAVHIYIHSFCLRSAAHSFQSQPAQRLSGSAALPGHFGEKAAAEVTLSINVEKIFCARVSYFCYVLARGRRFEAGCAAAGIQSALGVFDEHEDADIKGVLCILSLQRLNGLF